MSNKGWIGVDLDGTLAEYYGWVSETHIGPPIPKMVDRVKKWVEEGQKVKIMTARAYPARSGKTDVKEVIKNIENWCLEHVGTKLEVTYEKDYNMIELWDDRAIQVIPNTGVRADGKS